MKENVVKEGTKSKDIDNIIKRDESHKKKKE